MPSRAIKPSRVGQRIHLNILLGRGNGLVRFAAAFKPGHGPRISVSFGAMNRWASSPGAGTRYPPIPLPGRPPLALLYGLTWISNVIELKDRVCFTIYHSRAPETRDQG